jgi:hypothetical protein
MGGADDYKMELETRATKSVVERDHVETDNTVCDLTR